MDNQSLQKIGIYGGSFDPIHVAHLILAQTAVEQLQLDRLFFMPSGGKAHYKPSSNHASGKHRYNMIQLAIGKHPQITVSDFEVQQEEFSFTIDTLRHFRRLYRESEIYILAGEDWKGKISSWKEGKVILSEFKVAFFTRLVELAEQNQSPEMLEEKVLHIEMPVIDISSTEIRQRIREGKSIQYRVPKPVCDYIYEHQLYVEITE